MHLAMACIYHEPFKVRLFDELCQQFLPDAFVTPADEAAVSIAPGAVTLRQVAPRRASAQNPEYGVDETTIVLGNAAPCAFTPWQKRFKQRPGAIGDVVTVLGIVQWR